MLYKILKPGTFLLAALCFLLPFMRISCNNKAILETTGAQMAMGHHTNTEAATGSLSNLLTNTPAIKGKDMEMPVQPVILISLISLVIGLAASLLFGLLYRTPRFPLILISLTLAAAMVLYYYNYRQLVQPDMQWIIYSAFLVLIVAVVASFMSQNQAGMFIPSAMGLLAAIMLVMYKIDYKHFLHIDGLSTYDSESYKTEIEFLPGFWLAMGASILAAVCAWLPDAKKETEEPEESKPPHSQNGQMQYK